MNYISLGYFCSIAEDLETLGLRSNSYPFDWILSDFEGVINCLNNNFLDFISLDNLEQNSKFPFVYKNSKYNFEFYHDFNKYDSLESQFSNIQAKYLRRIERFTKEIKKETCFIRYISDECNVNGKSKELVYIEQNYDAIVNLITSFNKNNKIIFIANDGVKTDLFKIYHVKKDDGDKVNRHPLLFNEELKMLLTIDEETKRSNLLFLSIKNKKKRKHLCSRIFKKIFKKVYIHNKRY